MAGSDVPTDRDADRDADPIEVARQICLRLLTAAPRTRADLAAALRRRGVPDDAAEQVLGRLTDVGLIDDAAFAAAWVRSRHRGRGLARKALRAELVRRGVDREVIDEAVGELDTDDERAAARALVERRLRTSVGVPEPVLVRRLVAMLARKGYPAGVAFDVVKEVVGVSDAVSLTADHGAT